MRPAASGPIEGEKKSLPRRLAQRLAGAALAVAQAGNAAEPPPALALDGSSAPVVLGRHLDILRDDAGELTLDDVRGAAHAADWVRSTRDIPSAGATSAAYWYRVRLQAPAGTRQGDYVLDLAYPQLDEVDLHILGPGGTAVSFHGGDTRPTPAGQLATPGFSFPLQLDGSAPTEAYLRIRTTGRHDVSLQLWPAVAFQRQAASAALWDGIFFGVLGVMIFYNLILAFWTHDRAYRYYVPYLVLATAAVFVAGGYARLHGNDLGPGAPALINGVFPYLWNGVLVFALLFGREFLQTRLHAPGLHRAITGGLALAVLAVAAQPFQAHATQARVGYVLAALTSALLLFAAVVLAARGLRTARFYLAAWLALLGALIVNVLDAFGVVSLGALGAHVVKAGIALDVTILSLALADKINAERREKVAAREQALEHSQRLGRLRQFLPGRVADLVGSGEQSLLAPKRRDVVVLVMDLRGFTPFAEGAPPDAVMTVLREFYDAMGRIVDRHGGTVEHFAGDSMLVFFNAPLETPLPAHQALDTALEIRDAFAALRDTWHGRGHELGLGIGIAQGEATIGAIGFAGRSQYAAIGAVTNLAARLCSLARHGEILTTPRVLEAAGGAFAAQSCGEQSIKGFSKPVPVARVVSRPGQAEHGVTPPTRAAASTQDY